MNRDEPQMHTSGRQYDRRRELSAERRAYLRQVRGRNRRSPSGGQASWWDFCCCGKSLPGWAGSTALFMSSPSRILDTLFSLADNQILMHFSVTLYETLTGFVIGAFGGLLLAILLWQSELVSKILEPYLVVLNSLPKIALGPVIIIWVGAGTEGDHCDGCGNLHDRYCTGNAGRLPFHRPGTDPHGRNLRGQPSADLPEVVFPANIPVLFNSLKINIGLSLVGVIAGEFLVSKAGLGYLIVYGGQVFQLDLVMTRCDHSGADGSGYVPLHHPGGEPGSAGAQTLTEFCIV